jgi:hypothetical protein
MNVVFGNLCGVIALVVFCGLVRHFLASLHESGFVEGYELGHTHGLAQARTESQIWWALAEKDVDEARQEIWRTGE